MKIIHWGYAALLVFFSACSEDESTLDPTNTNANPAVIPEAQGLEIPRIDAEKELAALAAAEQAAKAAAAAESAPQPAKAAPAEADAEYRVVGIKI